MIKERLNALLPDSFLKIYYFYIKQIRIVLGYFYDCKRFIKHSATLSIKNTSHLEGRIIAHYHVLEKGLSHKNIRLGFGQDVLFSLISLLKEYKVKQYDSNNNQYLAAISVIHEYINIHELQKYDVLSIKTEMKGFSFHDKSKPGGYSLLSKKKISKLSKIDFEHFALSRFTIRDFTEKNVDLCLLEKAISIAQKSPSVCNRQTSRVHIVKDKVNIREHLKFQNGNRGFGQDINKLLIITSDLHYFESSNERNQSFVDGGIFGMSILNSLHYLELGGVPLNWCVTKSNDRFYRRFSKIPENENIIMMIGVGHIPEKFKVPKSKRKKLEEILNYV
jgi:nitroreductase